MGAALQPADPATTPSVADPPLLEPAFSVTIDAPAQFRGIVFHPDGTRAFVHVSDPAIDLWPLAVWYWPEILGGVAAVFVLPALWVIWRRARTPRRAGRVDRPKRKYGLGSAAAVVACTGVAAAQAEDPLAAAHTDAGKIRQLWGIIYSYTQSHGGELPADFGAMLEAFEGRDGGAAAAVGEHFVSVLQPAPEVAEDEAAAWVNEHSAYAYLARAGVSLNSVSDWDATAIAHLRLETGHHVGVSPENPEGLLFPVLFLDNHSELMTRAEAERVIADSKRVFDALATGAPLPEDRQAIWNAQAIIKAIRAYADSHEGVLPPDLGAALAHVAADAKRTATLKDRARLFLSPSAAEKTFIPDDPTPEWVNRNTSYVYLGGGGVLLGRVEDPRRAILLHAKPAEAMRVWRPGREKLVVTIATANGRAENVERPYAEWIAAESVKIVESARSGTPLPPFQHAMRDLRLLGKAIIAYAAAHEDAMPPDLGSLLAYVPDEPLWPLSPAERGAVFLSPRQESITQVPEEPTAQWVNRYGNYHYASAAAGLPLASLKKRGMPILVLVRAPLDEAFPILTSQGEEVVAPYADAMGQAVPTPRAAIEGDIARTDAVLAKAREEAK